ncbi:MAG: peptide chain release factor N(5)-glutamine methyltransferase [Caldimonas sp.]
MTVAAALAGARAAGLSTLDAQVLLSRLLGVQRTALITGGDRMLPAGQESRWAEWCERRTGGEPVAYLLGEKEFHGLMLEVTPDVLVPRPETELLVAWACELAWAMPGPSIVDLGTGSGAIALALKYRLRDAQLTATDVSTTALAVARRNAERLRLTIEFVESAWWAALAGRRFDIVVANPPYIAAGDKHLGALRHEPRLALTPGGDGLGALAAIVAGARAHLSTGGWLLLEHGCDQAEGVRQSLEAAGFQALRTRADLAGHPRASGGQLAGPP